MSYEVKNSMTYEADPRYKLLAMEPTANPINQGGHPRFYEILKEMSALHNRKNSDYTKGLSQGPLGNFIRLSDIKKLYPGFDWVSPFGTAIDYLLKQFDAMMILKATTNTSQTGEPVSARLRDIQIYAVIAEIIDEEAPRTTE